MSSAQKNCLIFIVLGPLRRFPEKGSCTSDSGSERRRASRCTSVSPSTIPLTLGEEMAVLVLPRLFYQSLQAPRQSPKGEAGRGCERRLISEQFDEEY